MHPRGVRFLLGNRTQLSTKSETLSYPAPDQWTKFLPNKITDLGDAKPPFMFIFPTYYGRKDLKMAFYSCCFGQTSYGLVDYP